MLKGTLTLEDLYSNYSPKQIMPQFMIAGQKGVGKTSLARTCRKPVWLQTWEPGAALPLLGDGGEKPDWLILDDRYQAADSSAIVQWAKDFQEHLRRDDFSKVGTFILDSVTFMGEAVKSKILEEVVNKPRPTKNAGIHGETMELSDWNTFLNRMMANMSLLRKVNCHLIVLAHIQEPSIDTVEEVSGKQTYSILLPGVKAAKYIPIPFSEMYFMFSELPKIPRTPSEGEKMKSSESQRWLLTGTNGQYFATSRIARDGLLNLFEKADIKALLTKAKIPCEDLPYPKKEVPRGT